MQPLILKTSQEKRESDNIVFFFLSLMLAYQPTHCQFVIGVSFTLFSVLGKMALVVVKLYANYFTSLLLFLALLLHPMDKKTKNKQKSYFV